MAKLIGIDWDRNEVRAVVGRRQGSKMAVEQVETVPRESAAEPTAEDFGDLSKLVTEALNKCGAARAEVIVSLGRGQVEFRALQIPPCDADEIPDVTRFQANRVFSGIGDNWPLDFVPMPPTEEQTGASVLAATVNPAAVTQLQKACTAANATLHKLTVRPMAAAQLLSLAEEGFRTGTVLLIAPLTDEADLTVCEDGTVVFVRSVRLPTVSDDTQRSTALVAEVRRTLMAYETQRTGGRSVKQIVLWGNGDDQITADMLNTQVKLPTHLIDPLSLVDGKSIPLNKAIGMAPVLGLLSHETLDLPQTIDFLHPRRRPPKEKPIKLMIGVGVASVLLLAGGLFWWTSTHSSLDYEIAAEQEASRSLDDMVQVAQVNQKKWQMVEGFLAKDIPWINELQHISKNAPPADDAVFLGIKFAVTSLGTGQINTIVATKSNDVFPKLESGIRDVEHGVTVTLARDLDNQSTDYKARVDETITVPLSKIDSDGNIILGNQPAASSDQNTTNVFPSAKEAGGKETAGSQQEAAEPTPETPVANGESPIPTDKPEAPADQPSTQPDTTEQPAAEQPAAEQPAAEQPIIEQTPTEQPAEAQSPAEPATPVATRES